jgi:hypothetical protein
VSCVPCCPDRTLNQPQLLLAPSHRILTLKSVLQKARGPMIALLAPVKNPINSAVESVTCRFRQCRMSEKDFLSLERVLRGADGSFRRSAVPLNGLCSSS